MFAGTALNKANHTIYLNNYGVKYILQILVCVSMCFDVQNHDSFS